MAPFDFLTSWERESIMELAIRQTADYEYLDAGGGSRLERFGPYVFDRPSPVALWRPEQPELWHDLAGVYHRSSSGGGLWKFNRELPPSWPVRWDDLVFHVKPTGFGHMGFFPEHTGHWEWVAGQIRSHPDTCRVLHLFAYTGAMSLLAARAGAEVCHVDAVKDINDWARRNAEASGLREAPIRWLTDDVTKFVAREQRRARRYDGIILDPPSYGKGPNGERWIIEEHLLHLLDLLLTLTADAPRFVLFTCHTLGFSPALMKNLLIPWLDRFGGKLEAGTMVLSNPKCKRVLPTGFFARWSRAEA
jgi:23S rRNA (cytosine1962-C5)-methyltransferase